MSDGVEHKRHCKLCGKSHFDFGGDMAQCRRDTADRVQAMETALRAYVTAQGRMLDKWADGDDGVKGDLWRALHACEAAAREVLGK